MVSGRRGTPYDDSATRAVACALDIDQFAQSFRESWREKGVALGVTRIGVNAGPAIVVASERWLPGVTDLDGRSFFDLTGSYGVNLFGQDFYKACIAEGSARVARTSSDGVHSAMSDTSPAASAPSNISASDVPSGCGSRNARSSPTWR